MKNLFPFIAIALLSSCGSEEGTDTVDNPKNKIIQKPIDQALGRVDPEDRRTFQKAIACEVKRKNGEGIDITPQYIDDLRERLNEDPSLSEC